ncbi:MAG TPA: hypothetical protein VMH49_04255 [Thermoplasmata archaeon]|nr:hypothetical protein [Thermoplasmata archaeon]
MHDYVASFYGGYDQEIGRRARLRHVPVKVVAVGAASLMLLGLVAADVAALESPPAVVRVTSVEWYAPGGILLNTSGGFSVRPSTAVAFTLSCSSLCLPWVGANASSPFQVESFAVTYAGIQYTNLTVKAPAGSYSGPLSIFLQWALVPGGAVSGTAR